MGCFSFLRRSSWHRDQTHISCIGKQIFFFLFLTNEPPKKPQLYLTCDK